MVDLVYLVCRAEKDRKGRPALEALQARRVYKVCRVVRDEQGRWAKVVRQVFQGNLDR